MARTETGQRKLASNFEEMQMKTMPRHHHRHHHHNQQTKVTKLRTGGGKKRVGCSVTQRSLPTPVICRSNLNQTDPIKKIYFIKLRNTGADIVKKF